MASQTIYDLRSDTVTKPSRAMRQAMANAEVGDDMCGRRPDRQPARNAVRGMFGKEAAVFACSVDAVQPDGGSRALPAG